jgi:hypothetical protein
MRTVKWRTKTLFWFSMRHNPCCRAHTLQIDWSITNFRINQNIHIMFHGGFSENPTIYEIILQQQMTIWCIQDIEGYKYTLRICYSYYYSTQKILARTPLNFTFTRKLSVLFVSPLYVLHILINLSDVLRTSETSFEVKQVVGQRKI